MTTGEARPIIERLCERARSRGMVLGLDAVRAALRDLGDPQRGLACVHVAGSNGKGSTSAMVESIARAAGLRAGLYTSPHLCQIAELVRIDGEPLSQPVLEELSGRVLDAGPALTFFEVMTVVAFLAFRRAGVDLAVVEVGLGGVDDATNVLESPLATAITTVSLEHTRFLGDTIEAIARAKAGILKPGAPVVLGVLPLGADRVVSEIARDVGAGPVWRVVAEETGVAGEGRGAAGWIRVSEDGDTTVIARDPDSSYSAARSRLALRGPHQARNAGIAAGIAWCLAARWPQVAAAIEPGLAAARWPGRMERLPRGGATVILDCAHNLEGVDALASALRADGLDPARTVLVFGALADKPWRSMLEALVPCASRRVYTLPRGRPPASLGELHGVAEGDAIARAPEAVDAAIRAAGEGGTVVVAGSIYLAGEVRGHLLGIPCDPVIAY